MSDSRVTDGPLRVGRRKAPAPAALVPHSAQQLGDFLGSTKLAYFAARDIMLTSMATAFVLCRCFPAVIMFLLQSTDHDGPKNP